MRLFGISLCVCVCVCCMCVCVCVSYFNFLVELVNLPYVKFDIVFPSKCRVISLKFNSAKILRYMLYQVI